MRQGEPRRLREDEPNQRAAEGQGNEGEGAGIQQREYCAASTKCQDGLSIEVLGSRDPKKGKDQVSGPIAFEVKNIWN